MPSDELAQKLRVMGGPMSESERKFLQDIQAFIAYAIRNDLSFLATMAYLSHDLNAFARGGFDFDATMRQGFSPRVAGFSENTPDAVGSAE